MMQETDQDSAEILRAVIDSNMEGRRLDKAVTDLCPGFSRSRLQSLIEAGELTLNGKTVTTASYKVKEGDEILLLLPDLEDALPEPENIPLDIVYEDSDVIVLNKQAGMVVHPGAGNPSGTLVNALLYHCRDSLSGVGGVRRPGIVHRLDKDTSGLMIVAKNDHAHHHLSAQLQDRSLSRVYNCLCVGVPVPAKGTISTLIGRHPSNRLKMAVVTGNGREALTHFQVMRTYNEAISLVECRLATGRTHQIRVHMESKGYPLIGDPLYGMQKTALSARLRKSDLQDVAAEAVSHFPRQALHAVELSFIHPASETTLSFKTPLADDLLLLINEIEK